MTDTTAEKPSENKAADEITRHMHVTVEKLTEVERKVTVEIAWDGVKGQLDEAYRELQHGVAIKGFRRGKVPRRMLEQLFGKHVTKEVAQRMVQETVERAFKAEGLSPVSEPQVVDEGLKDGQPFRYTAAVQVVPELEPKDYFDVEVKRRPAHVADEEVEAALKDKQRELTDFRAVEGRKTQIGDVVLVDLIGKVGNEPLDKQNELVELAVEDPGEPLPGLAAKLTGIEPTTEELEVELEVPVHAHAANEPCPGNEAKQRARLLVTIKDVKQKVVPELDDDFARDTGEAQTLAEYREVLRRQLLERDEERALDETRRALLAAIAQRNDVPLVPALVEKQLDQTVKLQLAMMGIDPDETRIPLDALKERLRGEATLSVRGAIVLGAIAKKEKIEVQEAEVEKRLAEIAAARGQNVARVRSEYEKENRLGALRARVLEDKTLDLLMSRAKIHVAAEDEKPTEGGAPILSAPAVPEAK